MRNLAIVSIFLAIAANAKCPPFSEDSLRVKFRGLEVLKTAKKPIFTLETDKKVIKSVDLKTFDLSSPQYRWDLVLRSNDIARSCENETDEIQVMVCDDTNGNGSCRDEADKQVVTSPGLRYAFPMLPMDLILRLGR